MELNINLLKMNVNKVKELYVEKMGVTTKATNSTPELKGSNPHFPKQAIHQRTPYIHALQYHPGGDGTYTCRDTYR